MTEVLFGASGNEMITAGADLNNYTKAGSYGVGGNNANIANWPTNFAGILLVFKPFGNAQRYTLQLLFNYAGGFWLRGYGNGWSNWAKLAG